MSSSSISYIGSFPCILGSTKPTLNPTFVIFSISKFSQTDPWVFISASASSAHERFLALQLHLIITVSLITSNIVHVLFPLVLVDSGPFNVDSLIITFYISIFTRSSSWIPSNTGDSCYSFLKLVEDWTPPSISPLCVPFFFCCPILLTDSRACCAFTDGILTLFPMEGAPLISCGEREFMI